MGFRVSALGGGVHELGERSKSSFRSTLRSLRAALLEPPAGFFFSFIEAPTPTKPSLLVHQYELPSTPTSQVLSTDERSCWLSKRFQEKKEKSKNLARYKIRPQVTFKNEDAAVNQTEHR